jgi:hypothetical protein
MTLAGHPMGASCFSKSGGGDIFEYALKHSMIQGKTLTTQPAQTSLFDPEFDKSDDMIFSPRGIEMRNDRSIVANYIKSAVDFVLTTVGHLPPRLSNY